MNGLAVDASDLAHHLLLDYAAKALIVIVALIVLAAGMTVIWRRAGRGVDDAGRRNAGPRGTDDRAAGSKPGWCGAPGAVRSGLAGPGAMGDGDGLNGAGVTSDGPTG
ncbi:hypothetical protein [Streptomyces sp. NPDC059008]|uniref:hypothetical protein n=1 Tax=Streptomyces sp. NPDC059008 TaxID=3346693 RepID=UPI00369D4B9C